MTRMELYMILKFGSFVALLDPLKSFMSDTIFKIFTIHILWGSHKSAVSITALSQTCNGAQTGVVDTFAVTTYHLVC